MRTLNPINPWAMHDRTGIGSELNGKLTLIKLS